MATAAENMTDTDVERLWSYVNKSGGPDACWPWMRAVDLDGYGLFKSHGRMRRVSRIVLELSGTTTEGLLACHTCDSPSCCNPRHLYAGTHAQNVADRDARERTSVGRSHSALISATLRRGTGCHSAKLNDDRVREILTAARRGEDPTILAQRFGVYRSTIVCVMKRKTWAHVNV